MQSQKFTLMLDSVRRLMRRGATARAMNVLHKGRPADVAQVLDGVAFRARLRMQPRQAREAVEEPAERGGREILARVRSEPKEHRPSA